MFHRSPSRKPQSGEQKQPERKPKAKRNGKGSELPIKQGLVVALVAVVSRLKARRRISTKRIRRVVR